MAAILAWVEMYIAVMGGVLVAVAIIVRILPSWFWSAGKDLPMGYAIAFILIGDLFIGICSTLFDLK